MKIGTVGHVLSNLDVKIQEDGEITVKGSSITQGYYNDEEKPKKHLQKTDISERVILGI